MTTQSDSYGALLSLSSRDVQYLVGLTILYHTINALKMRSAPVSHLEQNFEQLDLLFVRYYSANEANNIAQRLRHLLPADSPLLIIPPPPPSSYSVQ